MQVLPAALDLIRRNEGCVLTAYLDAVGVLTIGYGHTGADVKPSMTITQAAADALFNEDIAVFASGVERLIGKAPTTDAQFGALVSLAYNIGLANFERSTVLKRHIAGNYPGAADAFLWWQNAGEEPMAALVRRRREERMLYMSPAPPVAADPIVTEMKSVQTALAAAGFAPGPADGDPGPKTRAAMAAYRQARGL